MNIVTRELCLLIKGDQSSKVVKLVDCFMGQVIYLLSHEITKLRGDAYKLPQAASHHSTKHLIIIQLINY